MYKMVPQYKEIYGKLRKRPTEEIVSLLISCNSSLLFLASKGRDKLLPALDTIEVAYHILEDTPINELKKARTGLISKLNNYDLRKRLDEEEKRIEELEDGIILINFYIDKIRALNDPRQK